MKKLLKNPMFWGAASFLAILFITTTATNYAQKPYNNPNLA